MDQIDDSNGTLLLCPVCGGVNNHVVNVSETPYAGIYWGNQGWAAVEFECEYCQCQWAMVFDGHKGEVRQTVGVRRMSDEEFIDIDDWSDIGDFCSYGPECHAPMDGSKKNKAALETFGLSPSYEVESPVRRSGIQGVESYDKR